MLWLALAAVTAAPSQEVRVVVRAHTGVAISCTLHDPAGDPQAPRLAATGPRAWTWSRRPGDVLRCAGPGLEPLDADSGRAAFPSELTLDMAAARPVTVEAGWGGAEAVVEWRALEPGATVLLAQRRERVGDRLTLPVANRPRVLRLRVAGASPISLFIPEGASQVVRRVAPPAAGGEVFGLVPPHRYTPEALELSAGTTPRTLPVDRWRIFQASGVPPGRHALVARYRGGVRGKPLTVVVAPGETVEQLPLALPEPGAAEVSVAPELCDREHLPVMLLLHPHLGDPRGAPIAVLEQTMRELPCDREVEGLEEGEHQAVLSRAPTGVEVLSLARFRVVRGEKTEVFLRGPEVRLTGRVTLGEKRPAAGLTLLFELDTRTWSAVTDERGDYEVVLGPPGEYTVSVRTSRDLTAASLSRRFEAGEHRADLRIDEGVLDVRVVRPMGSSGEPVEVTILTPDGRRFAGSCESDEETTRFVGLKLGTYLVTARTPSGLTSERVASVELTLEEPAGEVEVVLGRHEGELEVVDEAGQPVAGAQVLAGDEPLAERAPGHYVLERAPAGERLRVRAAGYAPACRVLTQDELPAPRVVLARAPETVKLWMAPQVPWESAVLVGLPGSDCPVPLGDMNLKVSPMATQTALQFHAPSGRFSLVLGSRSYTVTAPGELRISGADFPPSR